ncbi:outer membrane beta-barrel protein [Nitrincola nitratireducens]|uniref:Outer membrane beta-barrel protein n=1 Tax=Nitrincola nitratireducens TaxID=1229521 RepID=W9V1F7_9GAMM|nr:outer membrane beta-barrel protein [Nitrincola nitratireducens]EXJ10791.1 hypothetical protein D791_02156 [Nitrincola nitratireducens]
MKKQYQLSLISLAISGVMAGSVQAIEPASVDLGGFYFIPTIELSETYDDNFRSNDSEDSSWITTIKPNFVLGAQDRNSVYELAYTFAHDRFHSSSRDNNTDHILTATANMEFNVRNRLNARAIYSNVEDVNDSGFTTPSDHFSTTGLGAVYTFGAPTALMNIEAGFNHERKRTENDFNFDKELNTDVLSGAFFYRVGPRTQLLVEARRSEFDYKSANEFDSTNMAYLAGVRWQATAFTAGTAKLGREKKDFKDSSKADVSSNKWEIGVTWQPVSYSTFNLITRQGIDEGDKGADNIKTTNTSLNWNHRWNGFITSNARLSHLDKDYSTGRNDKIKSLGLGMTYEVRRWMDISLGYQYSDQSSTVASENFDRSQYLIKLTMGL